MPHLSVQLLQGLTDLRETIVSIASFEPGE